MIREYIQPAKKVEVGLLTIEGIPVDEEDLMFEEGIYLSLFYHLCVCVLGENNGSVGRTVGGI